MENPYRLPPGPFRIDRHMKERFNYRADTAWTGRYLTRRPDRSLIYLEDAQRAADKQKL